jgi:mono/diheme cytochrome c family protein
MKSNSAGILLAAGLSMLSTRLMSQTTHPVPAPVHKPASKVQSKAALQASLDRGKGVYQTQCLACHQVDAGGVQDMTPPLTGTKYVLGDKTTLVQIVLLGMKGVEVNGDEYHNVMAPHKELTDQQIADVLTFVRNNFGNKARAITATEVKAIRARTKLN